MAGNSGSNHSTGGDKMPNLRAAIDRRSILKGAAVLALAPLAACQSASMLAVDGSGASASGTTYLARIRSEHGLPPLLADRSLEKAAAQQAAYMARSGKMEHTTGFRRDLATRMHRNGIEGAAAENIAHGRMDLEKLFSMWMDSAGHRRNMLDPRFSKFGLASAGDDQKYWALVLGR